MQPPLLCRMVVIPCRFAPAPSVLWESQPLPSPALL